MAPILKALIDYVGCPVPFIIHPCYWRKWAEHQLFRGQGSWKINCFFIWRILHTAYQSSKKAFWFWTEVFLVTYFSLSLLTVVWCDQSLSCLWTGWLSFLRRNTQFKEGGKEDHPLCLHCASEDPEQTLTLPADVSFWCRSAFFQQADYKLCNKVPFLRTRSHISFLRTRSHILSPEEDLTLRLYSHF